LAEAVINANWALLELRPLAMSLEDIFLELTERPALSDGNVDHSADRNRVDRS
jgi:hypothetical protein